MPSMCSLADKMQLRRKKISAFEDISIATSKTIKQKDQKKKKKPHTQKKKKKTGYTRNLRQKSKV